ncbi:hypothetical protein [Leifsonia kafniensis]
MHDLSHGAADVVAVVAEARDLVGMWFIVQGIAATLKNEAVGLERMLPR